MEGYCPKCKLGFKTRAEEQAHARQMHGKKSKAAATAAPAAQ